MGQMGAGMGRAWSGAEGTWPDGRVTDPSLVSLRAATRALRFHLDTLPAVFHFDGPGDQFLAESAFPYARWRYACADSLLGSGMGGTVVGALARSLFDDGLLWQWIAECPAERRRRCWGACSRSVTGSAVICPTMR